MSHSGGRRSPKWLAALAALVVIAAALPGSAAQAAITPAAGVTLAALHSTKCLNVPNGATTNGLGLIQYTCSASGLNDRWRTVPQTDGSYQIVNVLTSKCLTVPGGSTADSVQVTQNVCQAATVKYDKWKPEPVTGTNTVRLRAAHSNKCLNVSGALLTNSAIVIQYGCQATAAANERWYFPPATPVQPAVPVDQFSATSLIQAKPTGTGLGALEYAYSDNLGRLRHGRQLDPSRFDLVEWTTVSGNQAFSGRPALAQRTDGRVQTVAHNTDSDMWLFSQTAAGAATWDAGVDVGGSTIGHPTLAKLESGELVAFAVDAAGALWRNSLSATQAPFMGWRLVGGSGLAGPPTATLTTTGLRLFGLDTAGVLQTATYTSGSLSDWSSLGGSGLTGQPAVVLYPGYRLRVFVRQADGTIATKIQNTSGVFEADWQPVGAFPVAGSPAAILDPVSGRTAVVARGTDNEIYRVFETGQLTGVWGGWDRISPEASDPSVTDVTVTPFTGGNGESWLIAFRNQNDVTRVYERNLPAAAAAKAKTTGTPSFTAHSLPTPPAERKASSR